MGWTHFSQRAESLTSLVDSWCIVPLGSSTLKTQETKVLMGSCTFRSPTGHCSSASSTFSSHSLYRLSIVPLRNPSKVNTFLFHQELILSQWPDSDGRIISFYLWNFIHFIYALKRAAMHMHISSFKEEAKEYHPQVYKEPKWRLIWLQICFFFHT